MDVWDGVATHVGPRPPCRVGQNGAWKRGCGKEMGERFKSEETYVCLWLVHVGVWQKTTKFPKAIILQLKNKLIFKTSDLNLNLMLF